MSEAADRMKAAIDAVKARYDVAEKKYKADKAAAEKSGFDFTDDFGNPVEAPIWQGGPGEGQYISIAPFDVVAVCDEIPIPAIDALVKDLRRGSKAVASDPKVKEVHILAWQAAALLDKLKGGNPPAPK